MLSKQEFKDEYRRCLDTGNIEMLESMYAGAESDQDLADAIVEASREFNAANNFELTADEKRRMEKACRDMGLL